MTRKDLFSYVFSCRNGRNISRMEDGSSWYDRITFVRKVTNGKKISYVFSCRNGRNTKCTTGSYLAFCRNGVETRCAFCVTSFKMYSQPWSIPTRHAILQKWSNSVTKMSENHTTSWAFWHFGHAISYLARYIWDEKNETWVNSVPVFYFFDPLESSFRITRIECRTIQIHADAICLARNLKKRSPAMEIICDDDFLRHLINIWRSCLCQVSWQPRQQDDPLDNNVSAYQLTR
jgi:hypothetical protein